MSMFKRVIKDSSKEAGNLVGNMVSKNAQNATSAAIDGMNLFRQKIASPTIQNGDFTKTKGNLFEYIEAAKFNTVAASKGDTTRAVVTDAIGRSTDAADIELMRDGKVVRQVQAKFSDSKNAAADSVNMQRNDKYADMQRLIRKDNNYTDSATGEKTTLLKKAKELAKNQSEKEGNIYQKQYKDVHENLTDELNYDGTSSGGTTLEEVKRAHSSSEKFAKSFERKALAAEMKCTATSMAKASFVTTGIVSGITNMFEVFKDDKELSDAIKDVGVESVKSGVRGAVTGVVSTAIRYNGVKAGSALLSDSTAATVMAGGIIDGGVALYSYARGEITAEQLKDQLIDTTAKATTTIYFTKAITAIMGMAVNPIFPMVVYTAASYVLTCTREIIKNAELNAEEYDRMAAILKESAKAVNEYHEEFKQHVAKCEEAQRKMLEGFIETFDYNLETGENYDQAVYSIVNFANQAGIVLQHADFKEFKRAMNSQDTFKLK